MQIAGITLLQMVCITLLQVVCISLLQTVCISLIHQVCNKTPYRGNTRPPTVGIREPLPWEYENPYRGDTRDRATQQVQMFLTLNISPPITAYCSIC